MSKQHKYRANTARERKRRQQDPTYRERYNQLRRDYYHRMKHDPDYQAKLHAKAVKFRTRQQLVTLTDTQFDEIISAFGPNTILGCFTPVALRESLYFFMSSASTTNKRESELQTAVDQAYLPAVRIRQLHDWLRYRIKAELFSASELEYGRKHVNALRHRLRVAVNQFIDQLTDANVLP